MDIHPTERALDAIISGEPTKEKLRVALLRKVMEAEKDVDQTLAEMVSHLGQNLDIRV